MSAFLVLTCSTVFVYPLVRFSPPHPLNIILLKILRCQAAKVESVIAEGGASRFRCVCNVPYTH